MPRMSQYPNCCGVYNIYGLGPGGTREVWENVSEKDLDAFINRRLPDISLRAMVTMVVTEDQYKKYKNVFDKHKFEVVSKGKNRGWHGHNLFLLVRELNEAT